MKIESATKMKAVITEILSKHNRIEEFRHTLSMDFSVKKENDSTLVIKKHNDIVTIDYYDHMSISDSSDLTQEFIISPNEEWLPNIQLSCDGYIKALSTENEIVSKD